MMPNGWTLNNFNSVAELIHGFQFREHHFSESGVPIVKIASISHLRGVSLEKCSYISEEIASEFSKYQIEAGDVLMALTGGTLGKTCKVQEDIELCLQNYRVGNFKPKASFLDKDFLYYFLISFTVQKRIENIVNEAAQPNVGKADFDKIKVLTPPLPEQRKIATILETWDKAISTTERLIDNSKQQKKALMQQLLTGKKRLLDDSGNPFNENWEAAPLKNCVAFLNGTRKPIKKEDRADIQGKYPYYGATGAIDYVNDYLFDDELILLGEDGENILSRALPHVFTITGKSWVNNHAHVMKANEDKDTHFLCMYLESLDYKKFNSGSAQPKINKAVCEKITVRFPALKEQQKIASVLTNADQEIQLLEQQLADLKKEKKALMQQLLTGKRRVKVDGEAFA